MQALINAKQKLNEVSSQKKWPKPSYRYLNLLDICLTYDCFSPPYDDSGNI